jgi:ribosome-binding factor A
MGFHRTQRVGDLIKREISIIIDKELKDPRIGLITVTGVEITADLRHAKVFFSVLGDEHVQSQAASGLESARFFIQGEIGRRLRLKYTPELSFSLDQSLEYGFHIDKLLKELKEDNEESSEGGDSGS